MFITQTLCVSIHMIDMNIVNKLVLLFREVVTEKRRGVLSILYSLCFFFFSKCMAIVQMLLFSFYC